MSQSWTWCISNCNLPTFTIGNVYFTANILAATDQLELLCRRNLNKNVSLSCNWHATHSVVVMRQVLYAIAFRFNSHLGDFPYLFLNFFITFPFAVRFRLRLAFALWLARHFHLGGPLEGPVLQQGELSMVCVGLSERDLLQWHDVTWKILGEQWTPGTP